jgi:hypothetical protein
MRLLVAWSRDAFKTMATEPSIVLHCFNLQCSCWTTSHENITPQDAAVCKDRALMRRAPLMFAKLSQRLFLAPTSTPTQLPSAFGHHSLNPACRCTPLPAFRPFFSGKCRACPCPTGQLPTLRVTVAGRIAVPQKPGPPSHPCSLHRPRQELRQRN